MTYKFDYKTLLPRHRRYVASATIVAVLFILFLSLAPLGIGYALVTWLEGNNERVASIENVDFNPFTGTLLLEGVTVTEPTGRRLEVPRLLLDAELSQLLKKRIHLRMLMLDDGFLEVGQGAAGTLRLAGLPEPAAPQEPKKPSGWQVGVDAIALERLRLRVYVPAGEETFGVQKLQIENFIEWNADTPARFDAALTFGNASMAFAGRATAFSETPSVDAKLTIKSIDLARLQKFITSRAVGEIAGELSAEIDLQGQVGEDRKVALNLAGALGITGLSAVVTETTGGAPPKSTPSEQPAAAIRLEAGAGAEGKQPQQGTRITLGQARIADLTAKLSLNQGIAETVELIADTRIEALSIDSGRFTVANKSLQWTGKLAGSMAASGTATLRATGNFNSTSGEFWLASGSAQPPPSYSVGRITIANLVSELTRSAGGNVDTSMSAEVGLQKLGAVADDAVLNNEEIGWKGRLGATIAGSGKIGAWAEGTFDSRLLKLALPVAGLQLSQESAEWKGQIGFSQEDALAEPELSLNGVAESAGIRVDSPDLALRLLSLGSLVIDGIVVKGTENIHVRQVAARALETLQQLPSGSNKTDEPEPYVVVRSALTANDIAVIDKSHVRIKEVLLDGASGQVERLENGELRVVGSLLKLIGELGVKDNGQDEQNSKPVRVQIDEWSVKGNSGLLLVDLGVKPPAKFAIKPIEIRVLNIDSADPEGSVPIEIAATLGKYSKLDFRGSITPFSRRLNLDVAGKLTGLDLTALSSYSSEYMGYDLTRGRMDTEIHIRVIEGKLQTDSKLIISKLEVAPSDPKLLDPLKKRLQLPLETGLSLLRDSKDVIRLSVPVTGDITSPKFDFSDAINTAIGNAMKKTILATVKLAFPLGGVIMTMAEAGGKATMRFNPVSFPVGSATPDPAAITYLSKVTELLRSRPAVKISLCGWATEKDRNFFIERDFAQALATAQKAREAERPKKPAGTELKDASATAALRDKVAQAVDAALPELGKSRGEAVKDFLIKKSRISEERLFLCTPKVSKEADALPRVEMFL